MLATPLLLGGADDGDQFEPRVEPVAMQQDIRAVIDETRRANERHPIIILISQWALLFLAALVAYWPALHGALLWDDPGHITRLDLRSVHGLWRIWAALSYGCLTFDGAHGSEGCDTKVTGMMMVAPPPAGAANTEEATRIATHETTAWVEIFDNTQDIPSLAAQVRERMNDAAEPLQYGYLIRRHGLYTWGRDLEEARRHVEIFEFLFECVARRMMLTGELKANSIS